MRSHIVKLVAFVALFLSSSAYAQKPAEGGGGGDEIQAYLTVKPPDPNDPKTKNDAPSIEATVVGAANVPLDKFAITEPTAKLPVLLKATSKIDYSKGKETLALALVMNGQMTWIGTDDYEQENDPNDPSKPNGNRRIGILKDLKKALQATPFATAGPQGSKGIVITYADKAEIKVPMGPLDRVTAEALGVQADYKDRLGTEMVTGIRLALAELKSVAADRKVMIVICDGNDTDNDKAKIALGQLKKDAQTDKVQVFSIIWKGELSDPANVIVALDPKAQTVNNAEGIAANVNTVLKRMADRYYLTFPGYDKKLKLGLPWDGKSHDLVLKIDKDDAATVSLVMSPPWHAEQPGGGLWWLAIVIPLVLILMIFILVKVLGGKKQVEAPAMPAPAPMPMPEAPKPAGPMKTVMIGAGGDQDGFPIVGWIVPLNGQNAYQTFRLRSGGTKIGTAPPSDVVVNDGFMSTEHCQIHCSPQGFTLVDGGSTNGSYVNDRKVSKHDLVDNDLITLGKTNFKFKSIN